MDKDALLAKKIYNSQSVSYFKKASKYKVRQNTGKIVYKMLNNIRGKRILFAGCGNGDECLDAVRKNAKVTGIDISEECIKIAKNNPALLKAKFFVTDFEKTHFKNKEFDILLALFAVMYKKNLVTVLKEFKRIIKNSGYVILVVPHPIRKMIKYNKMNYFVKGKKFENWRGEIRFNYYRTLEEYVSSIVKAGFNIDLLIEPKPPKDHKKVPDSEVNHPHIIIFRLIKNQSG